MRKDKAQKAHEVRSKILEFYDQNGRAPTRDEFRTEFKLERAMRTAFGGSYSAALHAAGLTDAAFKGGGTRQPRKFVYKKTQIEGFFVHDYDLEVLFERAGNPDVIKIVSQPDTHVPFHDVCAVNAFKKFLRFYKPDVHIIMGDFPDMNGISHWPADSYEPRRLIPELKVANAVLDDICASSESVTSRFYLEGNHEDWLRQALIAKLPELQDVGDLLPDGADLNLKTFLKLEKRGYELIELNHLLRLGRAYFTHGIYTNEHHPAKHLNVFKGSIFYGHLHDTKSTNSTSLLGDLEAHSLGCLCRKDAKFMRGRPTHWQHAFGIHEMFRDGTYNFMKPLIRNGRFAFSGIVFDGNF